MSGEVMYTWNVAFWGRQGVASVGRYRTVVKARKAAREALYAAKLTGAWPDDFRCRTVKAASCDELVAKLPELFPPGAFIQSMPP